MFLTNKRIAAVLNFFGYFVLIAGLIGAFIAAGTVSELGGATIPTFLGVACASVLSSFVLIALSRVLKMLTGLWMKEDKNDDIVTNKNEFIAPTTNDAKHNLQFECVRCGKRYAWGDYPNICPDCASKI